MEKRLGSIVRLKRKDLVELGNSISKCSMVSRADGEDATQVKKFKYACGRNWDKIRALCEETNELQRQAFAYTPEFTEFLKQREAICMDLAEKDKEGGFQVSGDPENPQFKFSTENEAIAKELVDALEETFSDALSVMDERKILAEAIEDEEVSFSLYTVPFSWVPENLTGGYFYSIRLMLSDIPEELLEAESSAGHSDELLERAITFALNTRGALTAQSLMFKFKIPLLRATCLLEEMMKNDQVFQKEYLKSAPSKTTPLL